MVTLTARIRALLDAGWYFLTPSALYKQQHGTVTLHEVEIMTVHEFVYLAQ